MSKSLLLVLLMGIFLSCKAHRSHSVLEDIKVSPSFPGIAQEIWQSKDEKIHLGNCKDCKDSKDAAESIDRFDYEVKVRTAVIDMRGEGKKDYGPGLKAVQEKLKSMQEISKASGPDALNDEEKLAFKAQIAVLEQVLGLTEEEKKLIKPIFDALDSQEVITYHEGERRFALARAPFGALLPIKSSAFADVKVGWRHFPEQKGTPPSARLGHTAVIIDHKMIIWGGRGSDGGGQRERNDGAIFDFDTSTWTPLPKTEAMPRADHSAVVIGRKMLIWGGEDKEVWNDGWVFDLDSTKWSRIKNAPFADYAHRAITSDEKMIVSNGYMHADMPLPSEVAIYDVKNDNWTWAITPNTPWRFFNDRRSSRPDESTSVPSTAHHSAIRIDDEKTGKSKMIVWGGKIAFGEKTSKKVFQFDLRTMEWTSLLAPNSPSPRAKHSTVALDRKMIIWGGFAADHDNSRYFADGLVFDTSTSSWSTLSIGTDEGPAGRFGHSAVVFNNKMIIWGGYASSLLSDGWIYEFAKGEK